MEKRWIRLTDTSVVWPKDSDAVSEKNQLRLKIFRTLSRADTTLSLLRLRPAPVGAGRTTAAVMAHLLRVTIDKIFGTSVVLPYTNIIKQSVDVYRKSACPAGERGRSDRLEHKKRKQSSAPLGD